MRISDLIRTNIKELSPYRSARDEFSGTASIFLDANENPYGVLNRYPDPYQRELKQQLSTLKGIPEDQIFIGNGSDEIIDLLIRLVCEPGQDSVLLFPPTYGMYQVAAQINDIKIEEIPLTKDFQIDWEKWESYISKPKQAKIAFVCSPNNPTANHIEHVERLCSEFSGIVFLDEAYIDFSNHDSFLNHLEQFPNLIISQTLSKAWGLAAARVGVCYTSNEMVTWLNAIKPPYNVSLLNQQAAIAAIEQEEEKENLVKNILDNREWLRSQLLSLNFVEHIYPSDANFLLVKVDDATLRYNQLIDNQIVIRNRSSLIENCIRISIGTKKELEALIAQMNELE